MEINVCNTDPPSLWVCQKGLGGPYLPVSCDSLHGNGRDSSDHPQDMDDPQNVGVVVIESLLNGIGDMGGNKIPEEINPRLYSLLQLPLHLIWSHEGHFNCLHQKVVHCPPG